MQLTKFAVYESDRVKKWQEGLKEWDGSISERMINDRAEDEFWQQYLEKMSFNSVNDPVVKQLQQELLAFLNPNDSVMEIGPGWGNYTFSIADYVKELTCMDCSPSIIRYLQTQSDARSNLKFIEGKWEYERLTDSYDAVVGINCFYRMHNIVDGLLNMNDSANRLAVIGMSTGPEKPHYVELHRKLGYEIKWRRKEYIDLLNILYELGIYADCKLVPITKTVTYETYEDLIKKNSTKVLSKDIDKLETEKIILQHVKKINGRYEYTYQYHMAFIYWKPIKRTR